MQRVLQGFVVVLGLGLAGATGAETRVMPEDFEYLGAFRLPEDGARPRTFAWGGNAMSFAPAGRHKAKAKELPGSLFIMGHDRIAYGELPDGNQVAEIAIPKPVIARRPGDLPVARFLQPFADVAEGQFAGLDELPRAGLAYLDTPATGPRLHVTWGQHFQPDPDAPSHGWINPNLSDPDFTGTWFIGQESGYSTNGYLFDIPPEWAMLNTGGRPLATGRYRDGGWSGMGPPLYAYRPWVDEAGTSAPDGTRLEPITLLKYPGSRETESFDRAMRGYSHADEWEGGAWITTAAGKAAVLFAGTKSVGKKSWYGFVNPEGPDKVCVAGDFVGQFHVCRLADGTPCEAKDLHECSGHNGYRGWWGSHFEAQIILYDPGDLAKVAAGEIEPWQPQPYAALSLDEHLFLNPAGIEPATLGVARQRRYRIGAVAFDRAGGRLYVIELFADQDKPVVHVWRVE
ncbi:hypothetical protein RXV86_21560 [Alisedimentitalea sp. MJ-SS2]|uniref:hypothetical protein n=1 Tax=Aliisedimentitalea sp. MJ-SS2 TaxID=3049795 RepID=UPI00290ABBE5|nr:hypothetical protein [Alisedimentitalea sp. MJ-SS2]MDU8929981.1 hypothetical protein [Alisedimentitalea sp. MJ-SS2]